jgi:hypothetical protein
MARLRGIQLMLVVIAMTTAVQATGNLYLSFNYENALQNDVILNDVTLLATQVRSKVDCARRCAEQDGCLTFTFNKGSRSCRGHASQMTPGASVSTEVGSQTYQMKGSWQIFVALFFFSFN